MLTEKNSKRLLWIGLFLFLTGIGFFIWKENFNVSSKLNSEKIAQFGDFIGGIVGSLWSLAGVILFYVALTEQRNDIKINRQALEAQVDALNQQIKEFELQRTELSETRKVFKEQSETLKIQRFENTFFQLLSLHHELVDKLNFDRNQFLGQTEPLEKRAVLSKAFIDLHSKIEGSNTLPYKSSTGQTNWKEFKPESIEVAEERLIQAYTEFYFEDYKQILSHYYRNVYHIFKFIYFSKLIPKEKKQFYASLVRAQLSSDELYLILYNSLIVHLGYPNFLFLIKEYDIMQNFDFRLVNENLYHREIYDKYLNNVKPNW
ncbi:putative phage abortive infection protein [uncultured Tenacibaculum sp.]|uniref:putative phage abortive infection protein n=1 Tax=uncultured Tenacibaculum sp. TaxID=174713 RepID=UPI002620D9AB|nr:putative phage abortive infection protein [uncultured Tenacibaculum sp.]